VFIRIGFTGLLLGLLASCASYSPPPAAKGFYAAVFETASPDADSAPLDPSSTAFSQVPEYRIGVDDLVMVSVWGNQNLSITVPVRPDGRISIPLIGDVVAGGRTPSEVAAVVEADLRAYVRDPKVSIILLELRSHEFISRVRITGAVRAPLSVPYRQGMTVLDLVLLAGGPNEFAAPGRTRLYRRDGTDEQKSRAISVELDKILSQGRMTTNYALLPGDVITVPERLF
jgi:polysaccharide biosynthesis/export protein